MVIVLAAIMATVAFVVLMRLLWLTKRPSVPAAMIGAFALALVVGLVILAATGRMHWIAALSAAALPFLKRGFGLLRYLPVFRGLFGAYQQYGGKAGGGGGSRSQADMSLGEACEVLGLEPNPSRDDVIAAHRRLMQKVHPDRGGSTYLAQQLNEAKRVLLKAVP